MENKCDWCGEAGRLACGNCNQTFYCGKEHQKNDWKRHKASCRPFFIKHTREAGRFLAASRFLPAGSLVLKEAPFALGPKANSPLMCLTCHIPIIENNFQRCPLCQWPMCSSKCIKDKSHESECRVLRLDVKKCGVPQHQGETPRYDLILVLRCLLLRDSRPEDWKTLEAMESHSLRRKEDAEPHHVAAVRYLTEVCKIDFDVDTVHHVRGAIVTNAINTKSTTGTTLRGMYSTIYLLNHSCFPNITLRSTKDHTLYINTTVDVNKGEPLSFSYVPTTSPIWTRQIDLRDIYYFACRCPRCEDPSEMGTYFSSPKCLECHNGTLVLNINESVWNCNECGAGKSSKRVIKDTADLLEWINEKKTAPKHLRLFLRSVLDKSHRSHCLYLEALQKALSMLKDHNSLDSYYLKKEIWTQIIDIFSRLEPGLIRRRGISLLELSSTTLNIFIKERAKKKGNEDNTLIQEALSLLQEANMTLDLEPPDSTEDLWKELAEEKLWKIRALYQEMSS